MKNCLLIVCFFISIVLFSFEKVEAQTTGSVTFFVISDTHCDPVLQYDLHAMSTTVNAVASNGSWPSSIGGTATNFTTGPIGTPQGVVFTGDLMGWGNTPQELLTFRHYFEKGNSSESINFPGYIGLGNHDLDGVPDRSDADITAFRQQIWNYVDGRHKGIGAPVPVGSFDASSHAYSWDVAGVHFIHLQRCPGDVNYGLASNLNFLRDDLSANACGGKPVVLFHHYGMDAFGTEDRWWTQAMRDAYRDVIQPYNIAGIFVGHSHAAFQYDWEGQRVFQVNNAKAENGTGNNDGNGSFAIVRITGQKLEVVTCRWLDDQGHYEMIAPFYSGTATNKNPVVSLTSPVNSATYTAPAAITISANATDADGTISKVDFYNGSTLLNADASAPYSYNWTNVAAGTYTITAKATDNSGNTSTSCAVSVTVTVPESPYGGTRASIPGTVQAENYDLGGQNLAYNDATPTNEGGAYRTDAVDIEAIAGGGYNVGYVQAGEWMKYMVNVTTDGKYKLEAYVAATAAGKSFTLDLDGTTIATVNVPNTGAWQTWQVVTINNISLTAGNKILKFNATTGDFNLDKMVFTLIPNSLPAITITAPANNATYTASASVTISANATDTDGTISKVEFYNGSTLLNADATSPYSYTWTGVTAGSYTITAKAYDNSTGITTSSPIAITVNAITGTENCAAILPWKSSSVYVKDDLVTYSNIKYKAKWWTKGENPSVKSSASDVWIRLGECIAGTAPVSGPTISMIPDHASSIDITESITMNVLGLSAGSVVEVNYYMYKGTDLVSQITKDGVDVSANWNAAETGSYLLQVVVTDAEGFVFSDAQPIVVSRITSVDDEYATHTLKYYPNPTTGMLLFNQVVNTVNIFDLSGNPLESIQLNGTKQISLSNYSSGVYLIQFISTHQSQFVKVTKE